MERRTHGPRRLDFLELRAAGAEPAPSPSTVVLKASPSASSSVFTKPTLSTVGVVVVLSVVGVVVVLGSAIYAYRRRNRGVRSTPPSLAGKFSVEKPRHSRQCIDFNDISVYTEKPQRVALSPHSSDFEQGGWVPQIRAYHARAASVPEPTPPSPKVKTRASPGPLAVGAPANKSRSFDVIRSPPPSYSASTVGDNMGTPRLVPVSPPLTVVPVPHQSQPPSTFTPSPRVESFAFQTILLPPNQTGNPSDSLTRLPRLMAVATTFTPTLADELSIQMGEIVRMLEEYRDGWCLVQRVYAVDTQKGAVPRFCLEEDISNGPSRRLL